MKRPETGRRGWRLGLLAVALAASGCDVATDSAPRAIDQSAVPGNLLDPTTTQSPTTEADVVTAPTCFYLVGQREATTVVGVLRDVPVDLLTPQDVVSTLLSVRPDPDAFAEQDLTSAIPETATLNDASLGADGTLVVDLGPGLTTETGGVLLRNAFAQIVFTATESPDVSRVRFLVDGEPILPFIADGTPTEQDRAVSRTDYLDSVGVDPC